VPDGFFLIGDWRAGGASAPAAKTREAAVVSTVCARLREAGFVAEAVDDVARWKRAKLLTNLGNALDAFCVDGGRGELQQRITDEGRAVLDAAGLAYAEPDELVRRALEVMNHRAGTRTREGGSTWQSLARGLDTEVGHLNGTIVRVGREVGVEAPLNRALVALAPDFERGERPPRSLTVDELLDRVRA
jgi:2-dehydropantoate 2-reductase